MKKSQYHVINETVEFAKKNEGKYTANFVNAILRRYSEEILQPLKEVKHTSLIDAPFAFVSNQKDFSILERISIGYSFPEWLVKRWLLRYGEEEVIRLCSHLNKTPNFTIRVSSKGKTKNNIAEYFQKKGIKLRKARYLDSSFYVDKLSPILEDEYFRNNLIFVQDEASQMAGLMVNPRSGEIVLDACCGLGTKTAQMKEIEEAASIFSIDRDIKRVIKNINRGNLVNGDVIYSPFKSEVFDKILLDAPCSSLGIIRKHPEIKWRLKEEDIEKHGINQFKMLESLWFSLKKNGYLIYSVCSFEPEETTGVIEKFSKKYKFTLEKPYPILFNGEKYFISLPHKTDLDGFFIAIMKKI